MSDNISFKNWALVSCGTMRPELEYLQQSGWLNPDKILYTTPGLHQDLPELENQLIHQVKKAKQQAKYVLVVYGSEFCYINLEDSRRTMDTIIAELGPNVYRVKAKQCMDMLASEKERESLSGGEDVLWLTPGWIKFRSLVYKGWDKADANENFPKHTGGGALLDGIGYYDQLIIDNPEALLDFSDWAGVPLNPFLISLDRFKNLLAEPLAAVVSP